MALELYLPEILSLLREYPRSESRRDVSFTTATMMSRLEFLANMMLGHTGHRREEGRRGELKIMWCRSIMYWVVALASRCEAFLGNGLDSIWQRPQ